MKRSLIIDGQILQTNAWYRGMGKYVLQVLDELSRNYAGQIDIGLLLNDRILCDKTRFETLRYLYPNIKLIHADLPLPKSTKREETEPYKKQLNQCIEKQFPGTEKFYLLTALFLFDFFTEYPDGCHKLVLFYDLTPLLFWHDLGGYFPEELYMQRFNRVFEAEHIFAISETTRQDLLKVFGLNPTLVSNINGGFIKIADKTSRPKDFTVPAKFILFPTGDLPHKNNALTVKAFNEYCLKHKGKLKLLITSHFSDKSKEYLQSLSDHIIFTGNVSDNELEWLYENADAIIFSSKYEGLGMPILDAIANRKPIITSKIPVFEEMSKSAFYYFNPEDSEELERQIEQALLKRKFEDKRKHYNEVMDKYTWAKTTEKIYAYITQEVENKSLESNNAKLSRKKPRLAVCALHPGIKGPIEQLSEQLYFSLKNDFQVDYYFDSNGQNFRDFGRPTFLNLTDCKVLDITQLDLSSYQKYEVVVYILDELAIPSRVAQRAIVLPGIIIKGDLQGLDKQGQLMEQLILNSSDCIYVYQEAEFSEYQNIASYISVKMNELHEHPSPAIRILKKGGSKRRILNQLRNLPLKNEK